MVEPKLAFPRLQHFRWRALQAAREPQALRLGSPGSPGTPGLARRAPPTVGPAPTGVGRRREAGQRAPILPTRVAFRGAERPWLGPCQAASFPRVRSNLNHVSITFLPSLEDTCQCW